MERLCWSPFLKLGSGLGAAESYDATGAEEDASAVPQVTDVATVQRRLTIHSDCICDLAEAEEDKLAPSRWGQRALHGREMAYRSRGRSRRFAEKCRSEAARGAPAPLSEPAGGPGGDGGSDGCGSRLAAPKRGAVPAAARAKHSAKGKGSTHSCQRWELSTRLATSTFGRELDEGLDEVSMDDFEVYVPSVSGDEGVRWERVPSVGGPRPSRREEVLRRERCARRQLDRCRTRDRILDHGLKAELNLPGIYRPLRKVILMPPWHFNKEAHARSMPRSWEVSRLASRSSVERAEEAAGVARRGGAKARRVAPTTARAIATTSSSASSGLNHDATSTHPEGATGSALDVAQAPTVAKDHPVAPGGAVAATAALPSGSQAPSLPLGAVAWSEEDTEELSRMAAEEAVRCVSTDGKIIERRLRTLLRTAQPRLLRQVLARLPSVELASLPEHAEALGVPASFLQPLLSGDVVNSALLAESNRCRAAWLRRPVPSNVDHHGEAVPCPPPPLGAGLTSLKVSWFDVAGNLAKGRVVSSSMDADEQRHPAVEPIGSPLHVVPSLGVFRALLSAFTHGLSDRIPFGNGVVIGGSACFGCLAVPRDVWKQEHSLLIKVGALSSSLGTTRKALVSAMKGGSGSHRAASLIMGFAAPWIEARRLLAPLADKLYGPSSAYAGSDIDLFFSASCKAEAACALEETRKCITDAMLAGDRKAPCTVRTPNSVTLCGEYPLRHTQLVCKIAEDISEIVAFADMHCTALAYDGRAVWGTPLARKSLELGYNFMSNNQFTAKKNQLPQRVAKYAKRGCGTLIYELCRHEPRCDVEVNDRVKKQLELSRRLAQRPIRAMRWVPRGPTDAAMGVDGYDEIHLPRGSPADVVAFVTKLREEQLDQGETANIQVVSCDGDVSWWLPLLEWRRDRAPQLRRKFGMDATSRCYMCGGGVPAEKAADGAAEAAVPDASAQRKVPMCERCLRRNAEHIADREDLTGHTAVVTGGRCKIGYEACLMLLRCGAFVVTSTRFPRCAAKRFLKEPDAAEWIGRLHIYGVDFTDFPSLQAFASQLATHYAVDILVSNAAQTIRRPPAYYKEFFEDEKDAYLSGLGSGTHAHNPVRELGVDPGASADTSAYEHRNLLALINMEPSALVDPRAGVPALRSAALPMVPRIEGDEADLSLLFPEDRRDLHGEPLDLRPATTWSTSLTTKSSSSSGISSRELLEVLAVNAAAPFILLQQLVPVLTRAGGPVGRFVVNVTSAEGLFSSDGAASKGSEHPHSNMAKAALNMLTKTADAELSVQGVYCTAVDPGWVSMMRPGEPSSSARPLPPLSEADGAARVLAPILDGVRALRAGVGEPPHGVLLRNFEVAPW